LNGFAAARHVRSNRYFPRGEAYFMNNLSTTWPSQRLFRGVVLVFAFILACQAIWLITAEFFRSPLAEFPGKARVAEAAAANQNAAALAASLGFIRGDLWAEYALTYSDIFLGDERTSVQSAKVIGRAREVADRALGLAPYDATLWLLLAAIDARSDWFSRKASNELRMSYYTGANEIELIPSRLPLAINSSEIEDQDFQQLVRHDMRIILTHKPELIPTILAAYRDGSPAGQQFLEVTLNEIDPTLLASLRSKRYWSKKLGGDQRHHPRAP
jgi:hypothetical protein